MGETEQVIYRAGDQVRGLGTLGFESLLEEITAPASRRAELAAAVAEDAGIALTDSWRVVAPLPRPRSVVAIGRNYVDHNAEQDEDLPTKPLVFAKLPGSVIGPGEPIEWDPRATTQVDWEAELGVVIGSRARSVSRDQALHHVFGYTCINDVSARDMQFADEQWVRGKSLDTFCPMGPFVVTSDEVNDPQALAISCRVNGETMQEANTADMIFSVADIVSYCSENFTLHPGDVIATGTPGGVGFFREPPQFLRHGDTVEVEIESIGVLRSPVRFLDQAARATQSIAGS